MSTFLLSHGCDYGGKESTRRSGLDSKDPSTLFQSLLHRQHLPRRLPGPVPFGLLLIPTPVSFLERLLPHLQVLKVAFATLPREMIASDANIFQPLSSTTQ